MRRSDIFTAFVLLGLIFSVLASVIAGDWLPGLRPVYWAAGLGVLAGIALAASNFPAFAAHVTIAIYGLFVTVLIAGNRPDIVVAGAWRERVFSIADKLISWIREALNNGSSKETVIFVVVLSGLFWMLGYAAAYYTFRGRRVWHAILPAGITLFANVYQYAGNTSMTPYLVLYLLCSMLLLALTHFDDRERLWLLEGVRFAPNLRLSFLGAGIAVALISLLVSWRVTATFGTPATRNYLAKYNGPYNEMMARWNRMFATLNSYQSKAVDQFADKLPLTGPRDLSPEPVMEVVAKPDRYYWRTRSHDTYDGFAWTNSTTSLQPLLANDQTVRFHPYEARSPLAAEFLLARGTYAMHVPYQPLYASVPAQGLTAQVGSGQVEFEQLTLSVPLLPGSRYSAIGSVSTADIDQLRADSSAYPDWVQTRYLQVPATVSQRVRDFGTTISDRANARSPFDRAVAIELWLRENVAYDEKIPAPPAGVEASDYVLDLRRAYCTYYATTMIMMLRTQGVPARLATGYAQGQLEPENSTLNRAIYQVRMSDQHNWVEVFFPTYGWVEFEPTAGQPPIQRRQPAPARAAQTAVPAATATPQPQAAQPNALPPTPTPKPQNRSSPAVPSFAQVRALLVDFATRLWTNLLRYVLVLPLLLGLSYLALLVAENIGFYGLPSVEQNYGKLSRWARWLGVTGYLTPYEQARALGQRMTAGVPGVDRITQLYVAHRYGDLGVHAPVAAAPDLFQSSLIANVACGEENLHPQKSASEAHDDIKLIWRQTRLALRQAWLKQALAPIIRIAHTVLDTNRSIWLRNRAPKI